MIHFHIITIFPELIEPYLSGSILGRAQKNKKIKVSFYNPRDYTTDKHRRVDDIPYGGGPGMVMRAEPILAAHKKIKKGKGKVKTILFSTSGKKFTNTIAEKYIHGYSDIILIAGRYEGVDARVKKILRAEEVSIGDYILTGGELPACVVIDAMTRRIPGVLGKDESVEERRITTSEVYTRPEMIVNQNKKYRVPKVLLSGHHEKITEWKKKKSGIL